MKAKDKRIKIKEEFEEDKDKLSIIKEVKHDKNQKKKPKSWYGESISLFSTDENMISLSSDDDSGYSNYDILMASIIGFLLTALLTIFLYKFFIERLVGKLGKRCSICN